MDLLKEWGGKLKETGGKIKETFKDVVGELDPAEKRLSDLVERATAEALPGPDLGLNLAVVDEVNANPDVSVDAITRAVRRAFLKPSPHVQLLSLALLEMLVKNSVPQFFHHLATSELWAEMLRVGDPVRRWDPEVRDRVLCLIEDWGRGLPLQAYKDAYEALVDRGVDFPARLLPPDSDGAPYYTPPALPPRAAPAYGAPPVLAPGAAPQGGAHPGAAGPLIGPDVSAEDAAAIRAAVAEMEAEEAARHLGAAQAAAAGGGAAAAAAGAAGAAAAAAGGAPAPGLPAVPTSPRSIEAAVRVATNSAELLAEMLAPLAAGGSGGGDAGGGVREPFITDLADQCYRHRSVLSEVIPRCEAEELLVAALAANDDLSKALATYENLAGAAGSRGASGAGAGFAPPALPTSSSAGGPRVSGGGAAGAAAGAAAAGGLLGAGSGAGGAATANFSLLDEGEEEEAAALATSRLGGAARAGGAAQSAGGASGGGADLIDFGDVHIVAEGAPPARAGAAAPAAAAAEGVREGVAQLGLGAKPAAPQ